MGRKSSRKASSNKNDLQWLEVEEAPRSGLPDAKKMQRRSRTLRFAVWTSVVMCPIVMIALLGVVGGGGRQAPAAPSSASSSAGRLVATGVLTSWLASDPSPLPGGVVISWDGATEVSTRIIEAQSASAEDYEVITESNVFTVGVPNAKPAASTTTTTSRRTGPAGPAATTTTAATTTSTEPTEDPETEDPETEDPETEDPDDGDGSPSRQAQPWISTFKATVLVEVDSRGGVKPISRPSLVPIPPPSSDGWEVDQPTWVGLKKTTATPPIRTAIDRWAKAYISADPEDLRLSTGDPVAGHFYQPLSGPDSVTVTVRGAGSADEGLTVVARVQLLLHWPGQPVEPETGTGDVPTAPPFELDVLVTNANTGSPIVVAWGAPGTGHELEPFSNAVTGEREAVATTTTALPTTTSAPATSTAPTTTAPTTTSPPTTTAAPPAPAQPAPEAN